MRYLITASKLPIRQTFAAESESEALDCIDRCCADGFAVEQVLDDDGKVIDPVMVLDRFLARTVSDPAPETGGPS